MTRADNTYWPNRWIGDTGNDQKFNGNEMENFDPTKATVTPGGLRLDCTYTGSGTNPYQCGIINIGIGGSGHATSAPGYKFFSFQPGHGQDWALQIVTQFPPNTGEEDPGFWSSDAPWHYELDMFEAWGFWNANGWCQSGIGFPAMPQGGGSGQWKYACAPFGGQDPSLALHTITTFLNANGTWAQYADGNPMGTGPAGASPDMAGIWTSYGLRNVLNNGANFRSGTRSMYIRSITVYENTTANNANTTNPNLIAPGTQVR